MTLVFTSLNNPYLKYIENVFCTTQFRTPPLVMSKSSEYLMTRLPGPVIRISPAHGETVGTSRLLNLGNGYYQILAGINTTHSENVYWALRAALLKYLQLVNFKGEGARPPKYIIIEAFGSIERLNAHSTVCNMHNAVLDTLLV